MPITDVIMLFFFMLLCVCMQFLRDLRDYWIGAELSLAVRDNTSLVTGWDVLFSKLEDNLNELASLKQSPYFRNVPEFQVCFFCHCPEALFTFLGCSR